MSEWRGLPERPSVGESVPVALFTVCALLGVRGLDRILREGNGGG